MHTYEDRIKAIRQYLKLRKRLGVIPVTFESALVVPVEVNKLTTSSNIRIDLHRGSANVTVHWPLHAGAQCALFLHELLR